jgi:hypothetical protein
MSNDDYIKILLDSSLKESNLLWLRNSAFLVVQALLLGFVINAMSSDYSKLLPQQLNSIIMIFALVKILGIIVSVFHFAVILYSRYYNLLWFNAAKKQAATSFSFSNNEIDHNLYGLLQRYDFKYLPKINAVTFTLVVPVLFVVFWIILLVIHTNP